MPKHSIGSANFIVHTHNLSGNEEALNFNICGVQLLDKPTLDDVAYLNDKTPGTKAYMEDEAIIRLLVILCKYVGANRIKGIAQSIVALSGEDYRQPVAMRKDGDVMVNHYNNIIVSCGEMYGDCQRCGAGRVPIDMHMMQCSKMKEEKHDL
jgi:hypothetical protein